MNRLQPCCSLRKDSGTARKKSGARTARHRPSKELRTDSYRCFERYERDPGFGCSRSGGSTNPDFHPMAVRSDPGTAAFRHRTETGPSGLKLTAVAAPRCPSRTANANNQPRRRLSSLPPRRRRPADHRLLESGTLQVVGTGTEMAWRSGNGGRPSPGDWEARPLR